MTDEPSPKWTVRTVIADVLEELNPNISGDAAYEAAESVLSDLAAPEHRDALVAWLVEAGIGRKPETHDVYGADYVIGGHDG